MHPVPGFHTGFFAWGGGGGGGGDKHLCKRGVCDEKEGSGRQIPMSINMPQLIFQRAESVPPLPSQMSQAALSVCLGGGGGISIYAKEGCVMRKRGVGDKSLCQ